MNIKKYINKGKFAFEKNKGLIFTLLSAGFEIAAVVAMAKQAPKAEKVLVPANKKVAKLKEELNNNELIMNHQVYPEEHKKEMRKIQKETVVSLVKIYALPVIFTGASLAFMGGSYKVMRDKEIAIGAAYVTLDNAFKSYRNRVKEKFGDEVENTIYRDIHGEKVTKEITDKKGNIKEVEDVVNKTHSGGPWEIFFDATSKCFAKDGKINYETLMARRAILQQRLETDGYLFLSDVLDELMIDKTVIDKDLLKASRVVGWIYDNDSKWVDFGISDRRGMANEVGRNLIDRVEKECWLSFNPDGIIVTEDKHKSYEYFLRSGF